MGFSVLLSVYQKEHPYYLQQCLDSVFNQILLPDEVVLVKDGPLTDALEGVIEEFCRKFPMLKVVSLAVNQGLGGALNEGMKCCSYELVARMDTDDIAKSDRFEKQVKCFATYPDVEVCSAWIEEFENEISQIISVRRLPETHAEITHYARSRCPVNHPAVMFKKSAVWAAGGYKPFPLLEDYYLWVRMLMNGAKFYNIQESLLYFRVSSDMFKRRGGWKYAINELRFQNTIRRMGFLSWARFYTNIFMRFPVRILPNSIRALLYEKILRS